MEVEAGMEVVHGDMLSDQAVEVSQVGSLLFQKEGRVDSPLEEVEEELHALEDEPRTVREVLLKNCLLPFLWPKSM